MSAFGIEVSNIPKAYTNVSSASFNVDVMTGQP